MKAVQLIQAVQSTIDAANLCQPSDKILVAVSGGIDSMALAHILRQLNYPIAVAHCNFQLRGVDAEQDAVFVTQHFHAYRIQTWVQAFDTAASAQDHQVSIQVAARNLRYAWLQEVAAQHGFNAIALAHHLDDQAETILYDLVRGQHFATLQGIPILRPPFIRPLLHIPKQALSAFLVENEIPWREDASNASIDYDRNFIRHQVLPQLAQLNPRVAAQLVQRLTDYQAQEVLLHNALWAMESQYIFSLSDDKIIIKLQPDNNCTEMKNADADTSYLKLFLRFWLEKKLDFSVAAIGQVLLLIDSQVGAWTTHGHWKIFRDRGDLTFTRADKATFGHSSTQAPILQLVSAFPARLEAGLVLFYFSLRPNDPAVNLRQLPPHTFWLDAGAVHLPLTVRRWQAGDKMQPLGMQGIQLIADILTNIKTPPDRRAERWVILDAHQQIIFLQGFRIANAVKVTAETINVLEIVVVENTLL